jgi:ATP-dependent Clp protease adaptor protein ClpS
MSKNGKPAEETLSDEQVLEKEKAKEPHKFTVVFFNDDYTTQDFVVKVLMSFFHKSVMEAHQLMLKVHKEGLAQVGFYTQDVAFSKVALVTSFSRQHGMPLKVMAERAG